MKKLLQMRFVKVPAITIFIFIQILGTAYAQEKQKACLAPMGALGDISEMQKQIIFNSLQESLSTQYVLASQKAFEAAQTQAFDELEYDECTEDQCFALIQQILQVDNLFLFNMTREGNFTQLSLTRVDLDSQRLVRTSSSGLVSEIEISKLDLTFLGDHMDFKNIWKYRSSQRSRL